MFLSQPCTRLYKVGNVARFEKKKKFAGHLKYQAILHFIFFIFIFLPARQTSYESSTIKKKNINNIAGNSLVYIITKPRGFSNTIKPSNMNEKNAGLWTAENI